MKGEKVVTKKVCDHILSRRLEEIPLGPPGRLGLSDKKDKNGPVKKTHGVRSHEAGFCWFIPC